jgi:ribonuclease BN (tRNA processing enzyme)
MDIYILGSGTAIPSKGHSPAGVVVIHKGFPLLLDIGPGMLTRIQHAGLTYDELDHLLLTHLHPDHTLDLATLLQVFDSAPDFQRTRPFSIYGCRGMNGFLDRLLALYPDITPHTYSIITKEAYRDEFSIGDLSIKSAPSGHTSDSVAFRIQDGRSSLVYSGDASDQGELVKLAEGADVFICECSFPEGWETNDHLNSETTGRIAHLAGVQNLIVTHRYPPALSADLASQIGKYFKGKLMLANDGLHLTI